jgi:hypothetical protein
MKLQEISLYIHNLELKLLHHDWTEYPQSIDELLTDECVLAIYNACKEKDSSQHHIGSIRTSLWQIQNNQWKMIFHQASKIS